MAQLYVGLDVGKEQHWAVVLDAEGGQLLSRRVANDEDDLRRLTAQVEELGSEALWALDMANGPAALALALLAELGAPVTNPTRLTCTPWCQVASTTMRPTFAAGSWPS